MDCFLRVFSAGGIRRAGEEKNFRKLNFYYPQNIGSFKLRCFAARLWQASDFCAFLASYFFKRLF